MVLVFPGSDGFVMRKKATDGVREKEELLAGALRIDK
jgi:hypothetical protein